MSAGAERMKGLQRAVQVWPLMRRSAVRAHAFSLAGQVAGAIPFLAISIYLARTQGLRATGEFAALSGVSATSFTIAWWGFRSLVVADRLSRFSIGSFTVARLFMAAAASTFVAGVGLYWRFDVGLLATVILIRLGEGVTDLTLGAGQVTAATAAIRRYSLQNILRAAIILLTVAGGYLWHPLASTSVLAVAAALALVAVLMWSARQLTAAPPSNRPSDYGRMLAGAFWFGVAGAACAAFTSAPRMLLPLLHADGELFGAAGAALSISTFFGMAFYGSWVRWAPRFTVGAVDRQGLTSFLVETLIILGALMMAAWAILPPVVGRVYGIHQHSTIEFVRDVLVCAAIFFAAMNLANLFKATHSPWIETAAYLLPLAFAFGLPHWARIGVPALLLSLSGGLLAVEVAGASWLLGRANRSALIG